MPSYEVTIGERKYRVDSDNPLSDYEAYTFANEEYQKKATTPELVVDAVSQRQFNSIERDEDKQLKLDTIESLKEDDQTYDSLKENTMVLNAAQRFANDRLGFDQINEQDALEEVIEHFRSFDVNEMTAARDYGYVSGLNTDGRESQLNDYKLLYNAYESLPTLFEKGAAPGATLDYIQGLLTAPSTYAGLLLPGGGKVAGQGVVQANKLLISRLLNSITSSRAKRIATTAAVEGLGGVAQDVAAQKTLMEADIQKEYSGLQTTASFVLSATPAAIIPVVAKEGFIYGFEKKSKNLIEISQKAIQKANKKANDNVDKLVKTKEQKAVFSNIANKLVEADPSLAPLTTNLVVKGEKVITKITGEKNLYKAADINDGLGLKITQDKFKNIVGSLTDLLQKDVKKGESVFKTIDGKQERITEALARKLRKMSDSDVEVADQFGKMLNKYNLTTDDIANVFMAEVSQAGRLLSTVGREKQNLNKFIDSVDTVANFDIFGFSKEAVDGLKKSNKLAKDANPRNFLYEGARSLDQARLAMMTSQVGTTVRNTVSGYARVGFDILTQTINNAIAGLITGKGIEGGFKKQLDDVFAIGMGLVNRQESKAVRYMLESGFGNEASRLFRELVDIQDATNGKVSRLHGISRQVNALNTLSDNFFKEAALTGNLKRKLNVMYSNALKQGKEVKPEDFDLINIMKQGNFNKVFGTENGKKALQSAIDDTLYFTYQRSFNNSAAKFITQSVHAIPFLGTSFIPFPRFMLNAMKFTYEYSPLNMAMYGEALGAITGKGSKEYVQSYEQVSKGLVGMGVLVGATAIRMSENAGERWYEGKLSNGNTVDLRPMFPAAPYLFVGDLIARYIKDEPAFENRKTFTEGIQAISGANFKAGMGLYMLESGIEDLMSGDPDKVEKMAANFGGNILSTFTIPATVLQDPYNTFIAKDDERILRDSNSDNMFSLILNKTLARLPGNNAISEYIEDTLGRDVYSAPDPLISANTGEKIRRVSPLTRQLYGVLERGERTEFEKELERLKILPSTVYRRTRNPQVDALYSTLIGEAIQNQIEPYVKSDAYKKIMNWEKIFKDNDLDGSGLAPNEIQRQLLKFEISRVKAEAKETAREISSNIKGTPIQRYDFEQMSDTAKSLAYAKYNDKIGRPSEGEDYNYELLLTYAKEVEIKPEILGLTKN
ncbi:MAG: hypothetical protein CBD97_00260 [Pelagibacteraceae bacterium TMED237]|nr:MAG: hypothetical protein CBD97_00260 [Pelagibacteraceae bacterium TMED237]|tara:strand:- start:3067 stop:6597 length:3531 start_codon:yes stop_codon:yes gene_type:complete